MIGLSVLAAIVVLVGSFTVLFAVLNPIASDFAGNDAPTATATATTVRAAAATRPAAAANQARPTQVPAPGEADAAAQPTKPPAPTSTPEDPFTPDLVVTSNQNINLREGPGVRFPVVVSVPPGTGVQSTGQREVTQDPAADQLAPGSEWIEVRLEGDEQGWIRDVDLSPASGG